MEILYRIWHTYPIFIDLLLYFFVFAAAARVSFAKVFPGHNGKVLAVAIGLFLAAGLATAQRQMGFSLERMGPIAVLILCGIVFVAAYRFLQNAETPKPVIILICGLLTVAMLRAAMPNATARFISENPLAIFLVLCGLLFWAWHGSEGYAGKLLRRKPGSILAKHQVVPDQRTLKMQRRFLKRRFRDTTKADRKEETVVRGALEKAVVMLEREQLTSQNRAKVLSLLDNAQTKCRELKERTAKLLKLDEALRHFDKRWFKKAHSVDFAHLTPEQQQIVKESLNEERKRMRAEAHLAELEERIHRHLEAMGTAVAQARRALMSWNAAGAIGWINKAIQEQSALRELEDHALAWERRLIRLVNRQLHDATA